MILQVTALMTMLWLFMLALWLAPIYRRTEIRKLK
jgi:hypothetical protein